MYGNNINDGGCQMIAERLLAKSHTLTFLDMSYNKFGPKGLQLLLDAIATHPTLKRLCLYGSNINDVGCQMIAERLLAKSHTLTILSLWRNPLIGSAGVASLAQAVWSNVHSKMEELWLPNHVLGDYLKGKVPAEVIQPDRDEKTEYDNYPNEHVLTYLVLDREHRRMAELEQFLVGDDMVTVHLDLVQYVMIDEFLREKSTRKSQRKWEDDQECCNRRERKRNWQ